MTAKEYFEKRDVEIIDRDVYGFFHDSTIIELMDEYAKHYHEQKLNIASVSGKRPLDESFVEWLSQNFDYVDGDWYWKEDRDGEKQLSHSDILTLYQAACASGAVDTVAEEEDREIIVNAKPTAEYKLTISKIEKITREAPSGEQA